MRGARVNALEREESTPISFASVPQETQQSAELRLCLCRGFTSGFARVRFRRAEPYLDIYCVLLCHNGRAMEDGAPYSSQGKPTPCDDIIEAGGKQVQYAYIAGLNAAARKSREASADATGIGEHVALLQTQDIFPLNVTGAMIDGVPFSAPHRPYELLEVVYGPDWRVPRDYS
eukprot:COSAG03_NODE_939_length_5261_cov_3.306470_4_plen_174_part_00